MPRIVLLLALCVWVSLSSQSRSANETTLCTERVGKMVGLARERVLRVSKRFFSLLRAKIEDGEREGLLLELYKGCFATEKIAKSLVAKAGDRNLWRKITPKDRKQVELLTGIFTLKQIIYGRFGKAARDSQDVTVTITKVVIRRRDIVVHTIVKGRRVVPVRWYLTRQLKIFNMHLQAPFPSYMLNTYINHIARLAHSHGPFIIYKAKRTRPGEGIIKILKHMIVGGKDLNPLPGQDL